MTLGLLLFLVFTGLLLIAERRLPVRWPPWSSFAPLIWLIGASLSLNTWFAAVAHLPLSASRLHEILSGAVFPACVLLLIPPRGRRVVAAVLVVVLTGVVYADILYFRFFEQIVPVSALRSANQLWDIRGVIPTLMQPADWIPLVLLTGAAATFVWGTSRVRSKQPRDLKTELCLVLLLFALVVPPFVTARRLVIMQHPTILAALPQAGVLYTHLYDLVLHAGSMLSPRSATPEQLATARQELESRAKWARQVEHYGAARGQSLLLIQLESVSTWLVDAEVGGEPVMPFLRSLRSRGLYFPNVLSQTNHGGTADAEYAVLNSLHPLPDGAVCFLRAGNEFFTVADALRNSGYSTFAAHAYDRNFWNRAVMLPAYGFETSLLGDDFEPGETIGWGLADHVFFSRLIPHLRDLPQPYFAFIITLSLHSPFSDLPEAYQNLPLGDLADTQIGDYLNLAHYFDGALEGFLDQLESSGLARDAVIALYGDHIVPVPGRRRLFPMDLRANAGTQFSFVPLFVLLPDGSLKGTTESPIGQIDIGPTLLHLLGVERPATFLGRPALRPVDFAARWEPVSGFNDQFMFQRDRCFSRRDGLEVDRELCDQLAVQAAREVEISYNVTAYDLVPELMDLANGADVAGNGAPP